MTLLISSAASRAGVASGEELPALARAALAAGDLASYRGLLTRATSLQDADERYWRSSQLVCEGLDAAAHMPQSHVHRLFAAIAAGALWALEAEPREPLLLNWAGVALYELWALDGAKALFGAAHRLEADLPDLAGNLRALRHRRQQLGRRAAPVLHPEVPALVRHAQRLAAQAQPANGMLISLCMIVRDEQETLPRCLRAVAPVVDEMVIVDTGSRDGTVDLARSFGAKVIEHTWNGSFAEARNVSFDAATGDWLLYLDADEVLVGQDAPALRELRKRTWREAFFLREINYTGSRNAGAAVTSDALRVVRNRPHYRFQGRLHEQIAWSLPAHLPERIEATDIRIEHFGYLAEVRASREKSARNVQLLAAQASEAPQTPFLHYNLGSEHLAAGETDQAIAEFERAWQMLGQDGEREQHRYVPALANHHVRALRSAGRSVEAFERAQLALESFPDFTDLVFEQARAMAAMDEHEQALELCERCIEMGDAGRPYTATVGCGTHLPRMLMAELLLGEGEAQRHAEAIVAVSEAEPGAATGRPLPGAEDPIEALALRTQLLARLLDAGEQAAETLLFESLPDTEDRADALRPLLEALLLLHEFEHFERLLPLLEASHLPARELRELLAGMYLRQGFLASAAEEWMSVCSQAPDARALLGLAQIAQAQGMPEQALDFANAALACEPGNEDARQLLAVQG
jgi:tetratricopeptide (TPR) repeat protein